MECSIVDCFCRSLNLHPFVASPLSCCQFKYGIPLVLGGSKTAIAAGDTSLQSYEMPIIINTPNPSVPTFYEPGARLSLNFSASSTTSCPNLSSNRSAVTFTEVSTTRRSSVPPPLTILEGVPSTETGQPPFTPPPRSATPGRTILRNASPAPSYPISDTTPPTRSVTPEDFTRQLRATSLTPSERSVRSSTRLSRHRSSSTSTTPDHLSAMEEDETGSSSSEEEDEDDEDEDSNKKEKPRGEAGRPGSGGYNLVQEVNWAPRKFALMRKYVYKLIDNHLDSTKTYNRQDRKVLRVVRSEAKERFPDLNDFVRCWPVNDILRMRLKYTSERARRRRIEAISGRKARKASRRRS